MTRRIWTAYQIEVAKALRARFTYAGPVLLAAVIVLMPRIHPVARDGQSDYAFIASATGLTLHLAGLVFLLVFCASLVSSEMSTGVVRMVLVRPIRRSEFLAAKILAGISYALLLSAVVAATSWTLVLLRGDLTGVGFGGEVLFTNRQMVLAYAYGAALSLLPQCAAVAYAVFVSTLTRKPATAVGGAIGVWLAADMMKNPLGVAPYLFTTYFEQPWQLFTDRANGLDMPLWSSGATWGAATSVAAFILFSALAAMVFRRRNLHA
jgi:ABC-2 type transport system permease protein